MKPGFSYASWPQVLFAGEACVGEGTRILPFSVIGGDYFDHLAAGYASPGVGIVQIGRDCLIGHHCTLARSVVMRDGVMVDDYCKIGAGTEIGERSRILYGCRIYEDVRVGPDSIVAGFCCDRTLIGAQVRFFGTTIHRLSHPEADWDHTEEPSPEIGDRVKVGFQALVIGGVKVGDGANIGAGSIVLEDVPSDAQIPAGQVYRGN